MKAPNEMQKKLFHFLLVELRIANWPMDNSFDCKDPSPSTDAGKMLSCRILPSLLFFCKNKIGDWSPAKSFHRSAFCRFIPLVELPYIRVLPGYELGYACFPLLWTIKCAVEWVQSPLLVKPDSSSKVLGDRNCFDFFSKRWVAPVHGGFTNDWSHR